MKNCRRLISFALVLCIVLSMVPMVFADEMPFKDVPLGKWYTANVRYVYNHDLMNGLTDTEFAPGDNLTRGMLVTVLYRIEGEPEVVNTTFTDVKKGKYFYNAVSWAQDLGIVTGRTETIFDPNANITRQEVATIFKRYSECYGYDTGSGNADLTAFSDHQQINNFAKDAMSWAVAAGLLNGDGGKLLPKGNATRAQIAAILSRFCVNILGWEPIPEEPEAPEVSEPTEDPNADYNAAIEAYRQALLPFGKQYSNARFALIYIDADDIPELIMTDGGSHLSQVYVYTYYNKFYSYLGQYGMYGTLPYAPGQNAFGSYSKPMAIKDGQAVQISFDTDKFEEIDYGSMMNITEANINSCLK